MLATGVAAGADASGGLSATARSILSNPAARSSSITTVSVAESMSTNCPVSVRETWYGMVGR